MRTITSTLLTALIAISGGQAGGVTPYNDSFEGPALNAFWTARQENGRLVLSTDAAYSGRQSVAFFSSQGGQRHILLTHTFPEALKASFSIQFFDAAPGQETLYEQLQVNDSVSQKDIAEFFALLGGGVKEPGWLNTLSKSRLAIVPGRARIRARTERVARASRRQRSES